MLANCLLETDKYNYQSMIREDEDHRIFELFRTIATGLMVVRNMKESKLNHKEERHAIHQAINKFNISFY